MNDEVWKPIAGFESSYEVSNKGRVRSLPRVGRLTTRYLKGSSNGRGGYMQVQLYDGTGCRESVLIHRLVMRAFSPIPDHDSYEVNHIDLDSTNNNLTNLEWVTGEQNKWHYRESDKCKVAEVVMGEDHHLCKLTDSKVIEIREMWLDRLVSGETKSSLGRRFGVSEGTIRNIVDNKTWKHLL